MLNYGKPYQAAQAGQAPSSNVDLSGIVDLGKDAYNAISSSAPAPMLAPASTTSTAAPEILSASRIPAQETPLFSDIAGSATPYLGAAGAAAGAYGAYQGIKNKNPLQAGLSGLGGMAGISAMGYMIPGWGWVAAAAAPAIIAQINKMGDKDRWKEEGDRLKKLQKSGAYIPDALLQNLPQRGRSKEELVALAKQGGSPQDIKFASSRNVADLKGSGKSIIGYSTFAEKDPNWFKRSEAERIAIANQALEADAVDEAKGQISVDWNKMGEWNPKYQSKFSNTPGAPVVAGTMSQDPIMIPRSKTRSPGIDKEGNRIRY